MSQQHPELYLLGWINHHYANGNYNLEGSVAD